MDSPIHLKLSSLPILLNFQGEWHPIGVGAITTDMLEAARAAGCCGHITKPVNIRQFSKTVAQFLPSRGC